MADPAAIRVESVRCVNFRGIADLQLDLHPKLTILVGRNNAGKSRLLRALAIALGAATPDRDDFTVGASVEAHIDIVLAPNNPDDSETFDDRVGPRLLAPARQAISTTPVRERVSWRTTIQRSTEGFSARGRRQLRQWDGAAAEWVTTSTDLSADVLRLCRAHLIETGRDLASELRQRGTAAHRLLDDLELDPTAIESIQSQLDALSADVVAGSETLKAIDRALKEVARGVDAVGTPTIRPVPGRVDDLSAMASIELTDHHEQSLPLHLHGTGSRSLTSLRVQGLLYERRLGADGGELRPHAITLAEEPEAHLHPQAQFDLARFLADIPGQVIVSTHSTHLVSEAEPEHLRIMTCDTKGTRVVTLDVVDEPAVDTPRQLNPRFYREQMEKLRRGVERPFGELLFATAVVVGDGATERALLPPLIRHALGSAAAGVCVIDPGSMNSSATVAVVKAARLLDIPWFLFADGDPAGISAVDHLLEQLVEPSDRSRVRDDHVIQLPSNTAIEGLFTGFDTDLCRAALEMVRSDGVDLADDQLKNALEKHKGAAGRYLASELVHRYPDVSAWPQELKDLVRLMSDALATKPPTSEQGST